MSNPNTFVYESNVSLSSSIHLNHVDAISRLLMNEDRTWVQEGMNPDYCNSDSGDEGVEGDDDILNEIDVNVEVECDVGQPSNANFENLRRHEPMAPFFTNVESCDISFDEFRSTNQYSTQWDPLRDEPFKGLIFKDKDALKQAIRQYSIRSHREIKVMSNNSSSCWEVRCKLHEKTGCEWRLCGIKQKRHSMFEIVTYRGSHTCTRRQLRQDHSQLTSDVIANDIIGKVRADPSMSIKLIMADIKETYNYDVSYYKAWKGKQNVISQIFGDWDTSYKHLPKFMNAIKKYNPGSVVFLHSVPNNNNRDEEIFVRMFWAFQQSILGFVHCRPFLSIDATHLYGKYKGKLLIAIGLDANGQLFPLAFAIVKEESRDDWGWFLKLLRLHVVGNRMGICLVSDRHKGIMSAVSDVHNGWAEPMAHYRVCLRHLKSNFNDHFKSKQLYNLVGKAENAKQIRKFDIIMDEIKSINQTAHQYLMSTPVQKWTLCHDGGHRFGHTTTNISECFNGVLKGARSLPISALVQIIFYRLVTYAEVRREHGNTTLINGMMHCPTIYEMVEMNVRHAGGHNLQQFNRRDGIGEVLTKKGNRHAIRLGDNFCSCGKWTIYKVPCSHAMCMISKVGLDYTDYISEWFTVAKYVEVWKPDHYPLHHEDYWDEPTGGTLVLDPHMKHGKGRPKSTRFHNEMDISETRRNNLCGLCRQVGHDRRQCPARPNINPRGM